VIGRVGPLDSQLQYSVTPAKEGFVFSPTDDGVIGHFRSFKLGKIQVQVSDNIPFTIEPYIICPKNVDKFYFGGHSVTVTHSW